MIEVNTDALNSGERDTALTELARLFYEVSKQLNIEYATTCYFDHHARCEVTYQCDGDDKYRYANYTPEETV